MLAVRVRCIKFHVKSRSTERLLQFMRFSEFIAQNKKEVVISREAFRCSATNRHPHSRLRHLQRDGTKKIYIKPQQPSNKISFGLILLLLVKFNTKPNSGRFFPGCILSNFYIKPQPVGSTTICSTRCILSNFYIKPQPIRRRSEAACRCILSNFYIKPQHTNQRPSMKIRCILSNFYIKPQPRP